jgi:hypothetical protein
MLLDKSRTVVSVGICFGIDRKPLEVQSQKTLPSYFALRDLSELQVLYISGINGATFGEGFKSLINLSQLQLFPCDNSTKDSLRQRIAC